MAEHKTLDQARAQLDELIEAARTGALIPIRLPGQLEAIKTLLDEYEAQAEKEKASTPAFTGDAAQLMHENAEFLKTAVHELRTPMTSIRGYADMLSNPGMVGELTDMQAQLLQVVRSNARRMESLLTDMSYINKLRAGIVQVNEKMDMFKNIAMIVEKRARPLAEELNRGLEFEIPQGLPLLNCDSELLAHALYKLIENGLRYSPEETGKVIVRGSADENTLVITVEDNGIGMSPEEQAQLGELFFRADHDLVRSYKGSGLGIPIVYGIAKLLNMAINMVSEPEKGTTFTLRVQGMT
jgi:two-component system, cell cycle sensor histidine kinase DivJ